MVICGAIINEGHSERSIDTTGAMNVDLSGYQPAGSYLTSVPIGGASIGGVKNGGNVTINADGTMNASGGSGGLTLRELSSFTDIYNALNRDIMIMYALDPETGYTIKALTTLPHGQMGEGSQIVVGYYIDTSGQIGGHLYKVEAYDSKLEFTFLPNSDVVTLTSESDGNLFAWVFE